MSIASKVLDAFGLGEKTALKNFYEFCKREAFGGLPAADAEKLRSAMDGCGKTEADFQKIVAAHRRREELRPIAATLDAVTDVYIEVTRRQHLWWSTVHRPIASEFRAESQAMNAQADKLQIEANAAHEKLSAALDAVSEIDQLEHQYADALSIPAELRNFDNYTLEFRTISSGTAINIYTPGTKRRFVSFETFKTQSQRRQELIDAARALAHEAWNYEMAKWSERYHAARNNGTAIFREAQPERAIPTWADVLADLPKFEKRAAAMQGERFDDEARHAAGMKRGMEVVFASM